MRTCALWGQMWWMYAKTMFHQGKTIKTQFRFDLEVSVCQIVTSLGKRHSLFPSHIDVLLFLYAMALFKGIWTGCLNQKSQNSTNSSLKCSLPLMCLPKHPTPQPASSLSPQTPATRSASPSLWYRSKTYFQQIPKSNQIFTVAISSVSLLSFILFTECINQSLMSLFWKTPVFVDLKVSSPALTSGRCNRRIANNM